VVVSNVDTEGVQTDGPGADVTAEQVRPSRNPRRFWLILLAAAALALVLAGSWFLLPVRTVTVTGNSHLSAAQIERLAGLTPPFYGGQSSGNSRKKYQGKWYLGGWLYYGAWRAAGLSNSPWLASAQVQRRFPGKIELTVTERVPAARWQQPDGRVVVIAWDGTVLPDAVLPDAAPIGPLLIGWGPDRLSLARTVASAFKRYNVESVRYTPSGVNVKTSAGTVWSGSLDSLLKYAGSVKMFAGKHINIYPWGVSVQQ
jgi:cell division protein FtsQ